jgi:1D-myo-inositol-triphosphate 3-kinase
LFLKIIGSSLLFVHDNKHANIWMIDFGKTRAVPENMEISHNKPWVDGNHEDGYLIGIQSLIDIFQSAIDD